MTRLFVHGFGACAIGDGSPFVDGLAELPDVPIKEYASPAARRRYGRVARLMYVSAMRALADAQVADPSEVAVVAGTAMGELRASLELVGQIHATRGARVSPALVPNSVHNAPAGHLTIGLKNRAPSVTVSQGWLSAEAAIAAARDLLEATGFDRALVVVGDEVDATWADRLRACGAASLAAQLEAERFQEGAAALVLGREPGGRSLGTIEAAVERSDDVPARAQEILARIQAEGARPDVRLRSGAGGERLRGAVGGEVAGPGQGTSQVGALLELFRHLRGEGSCDALILGAELDELGWIRYRR
ncbi:MAG: beta-ketoacyl synthase chain length factor [Proteobacteria bacterium]|jgi:hypothetical protein|nr:beta-ketoacyl synthase chain length factor [Pseudomonadota bacterium]